MLPSRSITQPRVTPIVACQKPGLRTKPVLRGVWTVSPTKDESLKAVVAISAAEPPSFLVLSYASVCAPMGCWR